MTPEIDLTTSFPPRINRDTIRAELGDRLISNPLEELILDEARLRGRTALVTGSTRGIGKATALLFGRLGMNVIVHGRDEDKGHEVAREIDSLGGEGIFVGGDLLLPDEAEKILADARSFGFGKIDIGVVNAGFIDDANAEDMTAEKWQAVSHGNLDMAWVTMQALAKHMIEQDYGENVPNIVYISSVSEFGNPGQANYSAAKAGGEAAAKAIARRLVLLKNNAAVGIVRPAGVRTEIITSLEEKEARVLEALQKRTFPVGRFFEPEEVAHGIAYMSTLKESGKVLTLA